MSSCAFHARADFLARASRLVVFMRALISLHARPSSCACRFTTIVLHGRRGSKSRKGGQRKEVLCDDVSNEKQRKITKYQFFGKLLDGNVVSNGV